MAKQQSVCVRILLLEDVALSLALLMRDILLRTNLLSGRNGIDVQFTARPGLRVFSSGPVSVRVPHPSGRIDHLVIPPLAPGSDPFLRRTGECRLIQRQHQNGAAIHAACLGSLIVAQSGLLSAREATTHWNWIERAAREFPEVSWDATRMICDGGDVVTAGGFLAAVDLALALIGRSFGRRVAHEIGRIILADSVRQHQSVYATKLVAQRTEDRRLLRLEKWLQDHLSLPVTVPEMARTCNLSPRSFHREFVNAYGVTPKKFVQLKRIEKVRLLLRDPEMSLEEAMLSVGVSDVPSFRKVFRRELGLSPAEYRRRLRAE